MRTTSISGNPLAATYCDPTKAAEVLGWRTRLTIDDACRDYWNWQTTNPAGYATSAEA